MKGSSGRLLGYAARRLLPLALRQEAEKEAADPEAAAAVRNSLPACVDAHLPLHFSFVSIQAQVSR